MKSPSSRNTKEIGRKEKLTSLEKALAMIPEEEREHFEHLCEQYRFAAHKHYGRPMVAYLALAELVRTGWRDTSKCKND